MKRVEKGWDGEGRGGEGWVCKGGRGGEGCVRGGCAVCCGVWWVVCAVVMCGVLW